MGASSCAKPTSRVHDRNDALAKTGGRQKRAGETWPRANTTRTGFVVGDSRFEGAAFSLNDWILRPTARFFRISTVAMNGRDLLLAGDWSRPARVHVIYGILSPINRLP